MRQQVILYLVEKLDILVDSVVVQTKYTSYAI